MEEDSAKMNHQGAESLAGSTHSLVDFNRAGTPLAEIVSEPDMRAGSEAAEYGRELQRVGCLSFLLRCRVYGPLVLLNSTDLCFFPQRFEGVTWLDNCAGLFHCWSVVFFFCVLFGVEGLLFVCEAPAKVLHC